MNNLFLSPQAHCSSTSDLAVVTIPSRHHDQAVVITHAYPHVNNIGTGHQKSHHTCAKAVREATGRTIMFA